MPFVKSLKDISWQVEESEYRTDSALSYSLLAKFEREGFSKLGSLFQRTSTPSLMFGSIVDCLLTGTEKEFNSIYHIVDFDRPSDKVQEILDFVLDNIEDIRIESLNDVSNELILSACNTFEYGKTWKDITKINDIRTKGGAYFKALLEAGDKKLISQTDYKDALACMNAIALAENTRNFFFENPFKDNGLIERLFQLKFKEQDPKTGIFYRTMLDLVVVDHANKTIQPIDLKTSSHYEYEFPLAFIQWRYDIQARLYYRLLAAAIAKDDYFSTFRILPFKFVVINRQTKLPLVWDFSQAAIPGRLRMFQGKSDTCLEARDPYEIGKELFYYLNAAPKVPIGITMKADEANSIDAWLRYNG